MADFSYKVIRRDDQAFNEKADKQMGGGQTSPFKNGVVFIPNGEWDIAETNKGNCYVLINGTVAGVTVQMWLSTLLKTGMDVAKDGVTTPVKPAGLNAQAITANIGSMTCRKAAEWFLNKVKADNGYKSLQVTQIPFTTYNRNGNKSVSALCQFDIID